MAAGSAVLLSTKKQRSAVEVHFLAMGTVQPESCSIRAFPAREGGGMNYKHEFTLMQGRRFLRCVMWLETPRNIAALEGKAVQFGVSYFKLNQYGEALTAQGKDRYDAIGALPTDVLQALPVVKE